MTALNQHIWTGELGPAEPRELSPPAWVWQWLDSASPPQRSECDGLELTVHRGSGGTLVCVRLRDAVAVSADALEVRTIAIYGLIRAVLSDSPHPWPVRVWNFIPHIHQRMDARRDRYMVFNAGRFHAYCQWFGRPNLPQHVPTASGVGHRGGDLQVHCLAQAEPGVAIENPRQIPAIGYSSRYGPLPPCFVRATLLKHPRSKQPLLLVGGTASIRGEDTMHPSDLPNQTAETLENLKTLLLTARRQAGMPDHPDHAEPLAALRALRVYHPVTTDRGWIVAALQRHFTGLSWPIEVVCADLCRAELLIEIEGVAEMSC
jgi:chorismate lyase/3-hydroxybenzoate synthase